MYLQKLPDGNYATTPVYVGVAAIGSLGIRCAVCDWQTKITKDCSHEAGRPEGMNKMRLQECKKCGWSRVLLTP